MFSNFEVTLVLRVKQITNTFIVNFNIRHLNFVRNVRILVVADAIEQSTACQRDYAFVFTISHLITEEEKRQDITQVLISSNLHKDCTTYAKETQYQYNINRYNYEINNRQAPARTLSIGVST